MEDFNANSPLIFEDSTHYYLQTAEKWMSKSHGFETGVFQAECLAMIADPMGTLSKLLKCDSFLRPVFFCWLK